MKPFHLQWPRVRHRPLHISRRSLGDSKHGHGIERVQQRMERLHAHGPAATCQSHTSHVRFHPIHKSNEMQDTRHRLH